MLEIIINDGKDAFAPGEMLEGFIRWEFSTEPEEMELALYWQAKGKGSTDYGVVETKKNDMPLRSGKEEFSFELPDGPFSFKGRLIEISWALEFSCRASGKQVAEKFFVLSPTLQKITPSGKV